MTDEQAREILKKHCSIYGDSRYEPARWILDAMQEAVAAEREACAKECEAQGEAIASMFNAKVSGAGTESAGLPG